MYNKKSLIFFFSRKQVMAIPDKIHVFIKNKTVQFIKSILMVEFRAV